MTRAQDGWPWPGDTPLDRARRVAQSYRLALRNVAENACEDLDAQIIDDWGQTWLRPTLVETMDLDDWVTVDVAAQHVGLTGYAVYSWIYREKLISRTGNDKRVRVKLRDAIDQAAIYRRARIERAEKKGAATRQGRAA